MLTVAVLIVAFSMTLLGVGMMRDYALSRGIVDRPNYRSSHIDPTPRGGGLVVVAVFLLASMILFGMTSRDFSTLTPIDVAVICLTAGMVALTGWIDDHRGLSPPARMIPHFMAAALCVVHFGTPHIPLGPWMIDLGWVGGVFAVIAMVWCLNLFNFMDGIDGIAAVETISVAIGALVMLSIAAPGHGLIPYLALLAVTVLGFLVWNWPPAKIFMGDAASGFLGILLAQFALISSSVGEMMGVNVWCWLILLGVFFVDASVTLVLRMLAGENLFRAHRQHAYQRLVRTLQAVETIAFSPRASRANAHCSVVFATAGVNLFWLLPFAVVAALWPEAGAFAAIVALAPLVVSALFIARHTDAT